MLGALFPYLFVCFQACGWQWQKVCYQAREEHVIPQEPSKEFDEEDLPPAAGRRASGGLWRGSTAVMQLDLTSAFLHDDTFVSFCERLYLRKQDVRSGRRPLRKQVRNARSPKQAKFLGSLSSRYCLPPCHTG